MSFKGRIRDLLNIPLKRVGHTIIPEGTLYEWQKPGTKPGHSASEPPRGAAEYLINDNPRLVDLKARYAAFDKAVTTPLIWTDEHLSSEEMLYFRGDNPYVWQVRQAGINIMAYALTTYYLQSIDHLGLMEKLVEDDHFGAYTFDVAEKKVSRDLLDSIAEIYFLEKHLGISSHADLSVLDIGAGYGRLAYRMVSALPNIDRYLCTDAFPKSTFISEYYIRFRDVDKAKVVPLDEIEQALSRATVNLAINIHSFSECRIEAIDWWVSLLAKHHVQYLMIVPNSDALETNDGIDFTTVINSHGYQLKAKEPKYRDTIVQQCGVNPAYHYLFELR